MSALATGLLRADDNWDDTYGAKIYDSIGEIIADDGSNGGEYGPTLNASNARRLVACWNACDGLDTQGLEDIVANGDNIKARQDRDETRVLVLTHQRDQLSTALGTSTANYATLAAKLAQAESQRDALLKACRRAVVTLAHAAEDNPIYQADYDLLSDAISTRTRTPK